MADYEALRQRHLQRLFELIPGPVAHAREHSPWHRRRLASVDLARLGASDLRALPAMTKDDLMPHVDEIVTDPQPTGKFRRFVPLPRT